MKAITERQAVLFDLDGTLTDPAEGITRVGSGGAPADGASGAGAG